MKLTCIYCGCDEDHACMTKDGPCAWTSTDPPVCSACVDFDEEVPELEVREADPALCPASPTPATHQPLWTSPTDCHCVRCQRRLVA